MRTRRVLMAGLDPLDALDLQQRITQAGHTVLAIATSCEDAWHLAAVLRPDVVIMDLRLPSPADSLQAGTHIWATRGIPVIYVSEHFPAVTLQHLWPTALAGLLWKGTDAPHLHRAIAASVARRAPPRIHPPTPGSGGPLPPDRSDGGRTPPSPSPP